MIGKSITEAVNNEHLKCNEAYVAACNHFQSDSHLWITCFDTQGMFKAQVYLADQ